MGCGKSKHDVASGNTVLQHKKLSKRETKENGTETKDKNNNNVDNVSLEARVEQNDNENVKEFGDEIKDDEAVSNVKDTNTNNNVDNVNSGVTREQNDGEVKGDVVDDIRDTNNNNINVDNVSLGMQVEQKEGEHVKEIKDDEVVNDVKYTHNNVDNVKVEQEESGSVQDFDIEVEDDEVVNDVKGEDEKTNVQQEKEVEPIVAEGQIEFVKSECEKDDSLKENEQKTSDVGIQKMPIESGKEDVCMKEEEDIKDTNVSTSEGEEKDLKVGEEQ